MFQNILLIVFAALIVLFLARLFPRRERDITGAFKDSSPAHPFYAVSVHAHSDCCQTAKSLMGEHFLSNEAPHLPLEGCKAEVCHCVYRHHSDRRTWNGDRREIGIDRFYSLGDGNRNRRLSVGRRGIDKNSDLSWT